MFLLSFYSRIQCKISPSCKSQWWYLDTLVHQAKSLLSSHSQSYIQTSDEFTQYSLIQQWSILFSLSITKKLGKHMLIVAKYPHTSLWSYWSTNHKKTSVLKNQSKSFQKEDGSSDHFSDFSFKTSYFQTLENPTLRQVVDLFFINAFLIIWEHDGFPVNKYKPTNTKPNTPSISIILNTNLIRIIFLLSPFSDFQSSMLPRARPPMNRSCAPKCRQTIQTSLF